MKANELMLADWVSVQGAGPAQVVMVDQYDIITTLAKYLVDERKLEPIKITDEILESNGFELITRKWGCMFRFYHDGVYIYIDVDENGNLELDTTTDRGDFNDFKIQYVHELQHILRLIGINDLADNFEIEKGGGK